MEGVDPQDRITAFWNGCASDYGKQPRHGILDRRELSAWMDALKPLLPEPPADVLDLGTGTGTMAMIYAELGHRVRGIDLAPDMLEEARRLCAGLASPPRFEIGDARNPPGSRETADVIASRHLFWTLIDPDQALRNWRRLLRSRGRVLIIDGLWCQQRPDDEQDERSRWFGRHYTDEVRSRLPVMSYTSVDQVVGLVREAGFDHVIASDLRAVEEVERELHGSEEPHQPRYLIVASKPA